MTCHVLHQCQWSKDTTSWCGEDVEWATAPCQVVSSFLYISSHNACHKEALEQELNLTPASGSRITDWLSSHHRLKHRQGLGLIEKIRDPSNRRRQILVLTQKGRELANQIEAELLAG